MPQMFDWIFFAIMLPVRLIWSGTGCGTGYTIRAGEPPDPFIVLQPAP